MIARGCYVFKTASKGSPSPEGGCSPLPKGTEARRQTSRPVSSPMPRKSAAGSANSGTLSALPWQPMQ